MNYEQNEIDDIFKKGLGNQSTPYKNEYWALMEEMLDEKRPSIYGFGYKKWLSFVGLSSLVIIMVLIGSGSYQSENIIAQTNGHSSYPSVLPVISASNITLQESDLQASEKSILKENPATVLRENKVKNYSAKPESHKNENLPVSISEFTDNKLPATEFVSLEMDQNTTQAKIENRMVNRKSNTIYQPDFYLKYKNMMGGIQEKYQPKRMVTTISKPKVVETENMLFEKKHPEQEENILAPTQNASSKKANNTNKTEVVSVANIDFHILGGPSMGNAFNTSSTEKNKTKLGFMGGFGFGYYFNKKISLSLDIMYQKRNGHELERKVTSEEFFLYKKSQTYTLKTFNTDYLVLPIQVKYQVRKHHAIGMGLYTNFLLNSYNTIFLTTNTTNNSSNIEESDDKVNYGNWETVNYGYTINYEFNPTKNIGIGLGYYKGMKDATINSFYRNNKKDIMSDITLTLKYYLK